MRLRLALILMLSAATAQASTVAQGTMPEHADADRRWLADKTASAHDANSLRLWQATYTTAKILHAEGFPAKSLAGWLGGDVDTPNGLASRKVLSLSQAQMFGTPTGAVRAAPDPVRVPVPAALWLLLSGGLSLAAVARTRRG